LTRQHAEPIGVVLAGGLGRRIGGDKAVVELCGRPLIAYPVAAMRAALQEISVLAKADTALPSLPGVTVWIESDRLRHPLVGICEALALAAGRSVLVCAADLPFVTEELIRSLAGAEVGDAPAVVVSCRGRMQPLLGHYLPAAGPMLRQALESGEQRLVAAVESIAPRRLEVQDEDLLFNVNAPEDVLTASAMLGSSRR
jgi:molybdenum cofactor guanylyltransferase